MLADDRLRRPEELLLFGLKAEAGQRAIAGGVAALQKYGAAKALPVLFDMYHRAGSFRRPHLLAEVHGSAALRKRSPRGSRARSYWEAMYPLAYRGFIEKYGPSGENPRATCIRSCKRSPRTTPTMCRMRMRLGSFR